jgi:hypothetical protein
MLIIGIILIIAAYLTGISVLYSIGVLLLVVGLILLLLGATGHSVGGRNHWY